MLIYQPSGKAREYAEWALNHYSGCDHGCSYCFAPQVLHRDRAAFHADVRPRFTLMDLDRELSRWKGGPRQVLLSFTCDPYCNFDVKYGFTREVIQCLHRNGHTVAVLTKGGTRALRDLDLFGPGDAFAATLTCRTETTSLEWEPGAALPDDRIDALRIFHEAGITTWASLEPVLSPVEALNLIQRTAPFVDLYKVGTLNYHPRAKEIDWRAFGESAIALLQHLRRAYYIKQDLRKYLPADLRFEMREEDYE